MKTLLILSLLLTPTITFASVPVFPMAFFGSVTVDEINAPTGSIIRVYDQSTKVGEVTIEESGIYGYTEPTKQKLVVGEGVGTLTFTIHSPTINNGVESEGVSPITYISFVSGETVQKDLNFNLNEDTAVNSGGGGSSSSGGGGGNRNKIVTSAELVLASATSTANMSPDEQKIFMQKQLIELLTLLISLLKQKILLGI